MEMEEILRPGLAALGLEAEETALAQLRQLAGLLEETNKVMNLTAIESGEDVARLHFLDCAALLALPEFAGETLLDVGSGAGFPGLVLKILRPELDVTLLDSLDKRVGFLRSVGEALGLTGLDCLHARAEELPGELRGHFSIVTSRAVARLNVLSELCLPYVKTGGVFLSMKGPEPEEELREAERAIRLLGGRLERVARCPIPGTDVCHSVAVIRKVAPTEKKYPRRWAQIKKTPL